MPVMEHIDAVIIGLFVVAGIAGYVMLAMGVFSAAAR
jgi:hypothetical protein